MKENEVSIDYRKEVENLQEIIARNRYEYEKTLQARDEQYAGIINEKQKEIDWLKSVISGVLHIR